jgi:hypothetical protein
MNSSFTRLSLFLVISLVSVSLAMAGTACPAATYDNYDPNPPGSGASITCVINNLQFSQFGFTSSSQGGALLPTASSVTVTPQTTLGNEGFNFNPGFTEAPGQEQDDTITFEVTGLNGALINDLSIFFNGSFSGTGSTSFSETYCTTSFTTGCNVFQVQNPPLNLSKTIDFAGVTTLFITKDWVASAGTNGSAHISSVTNNFSNTVPEPKEIGLMLAGLVGIVLAHRKFRTSVS